MFYGRGAGAGATASAVVGDIVQSICGSGILPSFEKDESFNDISEIKFKNYISTDGKPKSIVSLVGKQEFLDSSECAFITEEMNESQVQEIISTLTASGINVLSRIRVL